MYSIEHKKYLKKIRLTNLFIHLSQILIIIFIISLWEYLSRNNIINSFIYSSPSKIIMTIIDLVKENNLFIHIWVSVYETLVSFILATILGLIIAVILWLSTFLYKVVEPYLTILNSLPKVALGPIIIIIFGANINSIIIMALLISLIITISNIYNGFINTDKNRIKLLISFGANKYQILKYLIIPYNYHIIINSLKINISMSLIGIFTPVREKILNYIINTYFVIFNYNLIN